jgi:hypothetical protein
LPDKLCQHLCLVLGQTLTLTLHVQSLELSSRLLGQPALRRPPQLGIIHRIELRQVGRKRIGKVLMTADRAAQEFQKLGFQRSMRLPGALLEPGIKSIRQMEREGLSRHRHASGSGVILS